MSGVRRIGFYIAQYLLTQGYDLAVLYKTSEDRIIELKEYAKSLGRKVV
ncbi:MAG: dehydrogenase, partial [Gammaproteobacteria bacterium]